MNIRQYHEDVREEKEKLAGEMLSEDLLRILGKIADSEPGVIKWVEHEIETEMLKHTTHKEGQEFVKNLAERYRMLSDLMSAMNSLFTAGMMDQHMEFLWKIA